MRKPLRLHTETGDASGVILGIVKYSILYAAICTILGIAGSGEAQAASVAGARFDAASPDVAAVPPVHRGSDHGATPGDSSAAGQAAGGCAVGGHPGTGPAGALFLIVLGLAALILSRSPVGEAEDDPARDLSEVVSRRFSGNPTMSRIESVADHGSWSLSTGATRSEPVPTGRSSNLR